MPTARKTTAKKAAARPRKTAAPRQNDTEKAVEAALKVYKSRVAGQVKHYQDTGDLCDEEYRNIRRELDLEEELESKDGFRFQLDLRGIFETEGGGCGEVINSHSDEVIQAIIDLLEQGITVPCGARSMKVKVVNTDIYEYNLQEWD